ncbi:hypothetical protein TELCIR_20627 [Teladorsagia circumcincta]|uniref:Uncharacterized protein n=1 Tax=Teladorsagia circumcincta TaxID=45464 RepID=A0A2G9TKB7_TELCI|nr:hypothetical protein TELCIR_20627 [Teladorsagia circumcincta]
MRGRTVSPINKSAWKSASYVQINIYDASLKGLREDGVDIKHMLQHTGYRCVIMEVPILPYNLHSSAVKPSTRRVKSFGGFYDYPENDDECDSSEVAIKNETSTATTLVNSFAVGSADERRKGPLTSTPITEKHGGCFDDFIFGSSCRGSQKLIDLNSVKT